MTNEQQRSPIFCLDKLKKHLYNTIWGIKPLLMYEYKVKPTRATHARQVVRQAAEARPPDQEDLDYEPHDCSTARNLVLVTKRGTMVDFLDHFETKIGIHIQHRHLVSTEHRSKLQYARNSRPLTIA